MPSDMERLAVYQAVMAKVADETKTGDPSNLRGAVDAQPVLVVLTGVHEAGADPAAHRVVRDPEQSADV